MTFRSEGRGSVGNRIRRSAKGKPCLLRIPLVCQNRTETTIHAHVRLAGSGGVGSKPVDYAGIRACFECHEWLDRRNRGIDVEEFADLFVLEGLLRTLAALEDEGVIPR